MPDDEAIFGDQLDRLSREIRQFPAASPETALTHACSRLAVIDPLSSAGVFRLDQTSQALEWVHLSDPPREFMNASLKRHHSGLSDMLSGGQSLQINGDHPAAMGGDVFIGLPAGDFNGAPLGLGLSSSRRLLDAELARLGTVGLLIGLLAENARLTQILTQEEDASSTARLIGFIAHELRTPLTGMRGNIQLALMANRKGQHERIPNRLEAAINGVDDMSGLVQQLLDVSRMERGAFSLNLSEAPINETVKEAVDAFQSDPRHDGFTVRFTGDADARITGDQSALQTMLCLLLKTSGQYSDGSGEMSTTVSHDGSTIQIDITYAGVPFSDGDRAALSAPLSSTRAASKQNDSLSLDLAYCRGVVHHHQGRIALQTDKPSPGQQTIEILLPAQPA